MTKQEVIDYISQQLAVPVTQVQKLINSFNKVLDFVSESSVDEVIPAWHPSLTFQTDGSDNGKYCIHADLNGKKRIWETRIDDNTNNEPPTDPNVTENSAWEEISQSSGSWSEWESGIYGSGLIIVYYNHTIDGPGFYKLEEPSRPFESTNIETEIAANKWTRIGGANAGGSWENIEGDPSENEDLVELIEEKINDATVGLWNDRGQYDPTLTNNYPTTGGSGSGGAIRKGDIWTISAAGNIGGIAVNIGDTVRALIDSPGTTANNWAMLENNIGYVPENVSNKGATNGYAALDSGGKVPTTQLPSADGENAGIAKLYNSLGANVDGAPTQGAVNAALEGKKDVVNIGPTTVTTSGNISINGVNAALLTLDCQNREESKFKYVGNGDGNNRLAVALTNFPEGAYAMLTIERTSTSNLSIRFKEKTYLLSNTQLIDNGKDALIVRGRSTGRTLAYLGFYCAGEDGAQNNEDSPSTTNLVSMLKFTEDTQL